MRVPLLPGLAAVEKPQRLFCTFRLGDQLFGVDVADVKEVNPERALTRIHHAPPQVLGYVNLRGQVFLVLDVRALLGLPSGRPGQDSRLVVFKPAVGDALAGLVDRIGDIVAIEPERIEPWTAKPGDSVPGQPSAGWRADLITGIARLDEELLILLQAGQFPRVVEEAMNS